MINAIKKDFSIQMDIATTYIDRLKKEFKNFIYDYSQAINEINALKDNSVIASIETIVRNYLPDADPVAIVRGGILRHDEGPYAEYLKLKSKGWNFTLAKENISRYADFYLNEQKGMLKNSTMNGKIGTYYFDLKRIDLNVSTTSATTIDFTHSNEMEPKVILFSDKSTHSVEKDEVGLENFKEEISPKYIKNLQTHISSHAQKRYSEIVGDEFIPQHHKKLIQALEDFMSAMSARKKS